MRLLLLTSAALFAALFAALPPARADEGDDQLARQLAGVVRDPRLSVWQRVEAAKMLGKMGQRGGAAAADLTAVLGRFRGPEQEPLQEAVVDALGQMGSPAKGSLPTLARSANRSVDIDQAIKRSADAILAAPDERDVDALVRQLTSRDPSVRLRATKALALIGLAAQAAGPVLITTLADPDGDVRRGAIAAIRAIFPGARPAEPLIRAIAADLSDPDPNLRLLAVRALGRIGPPAALAAEGIDALRADPDADVRRAATDALARVVGAP
jgi:HEAT repeat protein